MPVLTVTEDALIAAIKGALGQNVKTVDSLPGNWDANMLSRLIVNAPAAYVAFLGGSAPGTSDTLAALSSLWGVYAVTTDPSGQATRRRGGPVSIGAYEILQRVVPTLHNLTITDVGTLAFTGIDNLFTGTLAKQNLTIYEAQFKLPLTFENEVVTALDDFITFHADYDFAPPDGQIDAADQVTLDQ